MLSPRQAFEDNIRPAELLLRVYRLLENDTVHTSGEMLKSLRTTVGASDDEDLLMIYNEIFLGLVREKADMRSSNFKKASLCNLLRQAVVVACTSLDAYLPSLLRENMPLVIKAKGRDFFPRGQQDMQEFFKELSFSLEDALRLLIEPDDGPEFIALKILSLTSFKYLSSRKGIHVVASLLALSSPWDQIAIKLQEDKKSLMSVIEETTKRRNDIVHRADRPQTDPSGEIQEISYSWSKRAIDTIFHVCLALDELVADKAKELKTHVEAIQV